MVEEEDYTKDILTIEEPAVRTTETEFVDEPAQNKEEQHELFNVDNQTGKCRRLPRIQYEDVHISSVECIDTQSKKIICRCCYCKVQISPHCTLK